MKELKKFLDENTNYIFKENLDSLNLIGLKKKQKLFIKIMNYTTSDERNGKEFVSVNCSDGTFSCGCPCGDYNEVVLRIYGYIRLFGLNPKNKGEIK